MCFHLPRSRFAGRAHPPIQILRQSIDLPAPHREGISSALPCWIEWRVCRRQINMPQIYFAQANPWFSWNYSMKLPKLICCKIAVMANNRTILTRPKFTRMVCDWQIYWKWQAVHLRGRNAIESDGLLRKKVVMLAVEMDAFNACAVTVRSCSEWRFGVVVDDNITESINLIDNCQSKNTKLLLILCAENKNPDDEFHSKRFWFETVWAGMAGVNALTWNMRQSGARAPTRTYL